MGEDDSGFGLLGHVAAPYQLGLPRIAVACALRRAALSRIDVRKRPMTAHADRRDQARQNSTSAFASSTGLKTTPGKLASTGANSDHTPLHDRSIVRPWGRNAAR